MRRPWALLDNSLLALTEGYTWLPALVPAPPPAWPTPGCLASARSACAARFFYDENHSRRHTAIPWPVQSTLFGHGAVHTLDGEHHRVRKSLFHAVVTPDTTADPLDDADVAAVAHDLVAMVDGFATPGPRHWRARTARNRREAWLGDLITRVRAGQATAPPKSALDVVVHHREPGGQQLNPRLAAVELLNVIRPTVAVCWFVAYAGHALHRWPEHRERLRSGDVAYAEAFTHELRRFYPFAPFIGGRAVKTLAWNGDRGRRPPHQPPLSGRAVHDRHPADPRRPAGALGLRRAGPGPDPMK